MVLEEAGLTLDAKWQPSAFVGLAWEEGYPYQPCQTTHLVVESRLSSYFLYVFDYSMWSHVVVSLIF